MSAVGSPSLEPNVHINPKPVLSTQSIRCDRITIIVLQILCIVLEVLTIMAVCNPQFFCKIFHL